MADATYKRLDKDQLIFLTQYMFTKLKNSPLNTTYTIDRSGDDILLKDDKGVTISTVSAKTFTEYDIIGIVNSKIAEVHQMSFTVLESLPTTGESTKIYLIKNSGSGNNVYDEYLYVNSKWEKIGTTDVDLSGYVKSEDISTLTNAEITTIVDDAYKEVFK